jgi:hypothetical protein
MELRLEPLGNLLEEVDPFGKGLAHLREPLALSMAVVFRRGLGLRMSSVGTRSRIVPECLAYAPQDDGTPGVHL